MVEQSLNELIYSIAMEEDALAHIICAETGKIHAAINTPGITIKELLCINNYVDDALGSIIRLENFLTAKLEIALRKEKGCF